MPHFPPQLRGLPKFAGPFDAFKLEARNNSGSMKPPAAHPDSVLEPAAASG